MSATIIAFPLVRLAPPAATAPAPEVRSLERAALSLTPLAAHQAGIISTAFLQALGDQEQVFPESFLYHTDAEDTDADTLDLFVAPGTHTQALLRPALEEIWREAGEAGAQPVPFVTPGTCTQILALFDPRAQGRLLGAVAYDLDLRPGPARGIEEQIWHERKPGPTVQVCLQVQAVLLRPGGSPCGRQGCDCGTTILDALAIALAQGMSDGVCLLDHNLGDKALQFRSYHFWVQLSAEDGATEVYARPSSDASRDLVRRLGAAIRTEFHFRQQYGSPFPNIDMFEAL